MSSLLGVVFVIAAVGAQSPKPVTRPAPPRPEAPLPTQAPPTTLGALFPDEAPPSQQTIGVTVYPSAQFLTSYDAGRGQRYYLYGATASAG